MIKNTIRETILYQILWELDDRTLKEASDYFACLAESFDEDYPGAKIDIQYDDCNLVTMDIVHYIEETDEQAQARERKAMTELMQKQRLDREGKIALRDQLNKELGE